MSSECRVLMASKRKMSCGNKNWMGLGEGRTGRVGFLVCEQRAL